MQLRRPRFADKNAIKGANLHEPDCFTGAIAQNKDHPGDACHLPAEPVGAVVIRQPDATQGHGKAARRRAVFDGVVDRRPGQPRAGESARGARRGRQALRSGGPGRAGGDTADDRAAPGAARLVQRRRLCHRRRREGDRRFSAAGRARRRQLRRSRLHCDATQDRRRSDRPTGDRQARRRSGFRHDRGDPRRVGVGDRRASRSDRARRVQFSRRNHREPLRRDRRLSARRCAKSLGDYRLRQETCDGNATSAGSQPDHRSLHRRLRELDRRRQSAGRRGACVGQEDSGRRLVSGRQSADRRSLFADPPDAAAHAVGDAGAHRIGWRADLVDRSASALALAGCRRNARATVLFRRDAAASGHQRR